MDSRKVSGAGTAGRVMSPSSDVSTVACSPLKLLMSPLTLVLNKLLHRTANSERFGEMAAEEGQGQKLTWTGYK